MAGASSLRAPTEFLRVFALDWELELVDIALGGPQAARAPDRLPPRVHATGCPSA